MDIAHNISQGKSINSETTEKNLKSKRPFFQQGIFGFITSQGKKIAFSATDNLLERAFALGCNTVCSVACTCAFTAVLGPAYGACGAALGGTLGEVCGTACKEACCLQTSQFMGQKMERE